MRGYFIFYLYFSMLICFIDNWHGKCIMKSLLIQLVMMAW
ncbi:hypothetical protein DDI_3026 [Dickeya dianthicola RNS04.9]|nr:hypothetical protein DDI_3026 [Dickeya dianthicola RNS04.9]